MHSRLFRTGTRTFLNSYFTMTIRMRSGTVRTLAPFRSVLPSSFVHYWVSLPQVRHHSSSSEKRFHCSVCKKSFRLEKAAQLHLEQAHNSDGSIESGAGPSSDSNTLPLRSHSIPSGPTVITESLQSTMQDEGFRYRGSRPIPKPLFTPEKEVPADVIKDILNVWDTVGVERLGGKFIQSSMVLKIPAASSAGEKTASLHGFTSQTENISHTQLELQAHRVDSDNICHTNLDNSHVKASMDYPNLSNDDLHDSLPPKKGSEPRRTLSATTKLIDTVPMAPAGQIAQTFPQVPIFGEEAQQPNAVTNRTRGQDQQPIAWLSVASPFTNAVVDESPFVGKASELAGSSCTPQSLVSPFLSPVFAPDQTVSPTPLASESNPSKSMPTTPASPFVLTPSGEAVASPFVSNGVPLFESVAPHFSFDGTNLNMLNVNASPEYKCDSCGRSFSSYEGLRMHAQAKHGVKLPAKETNDKSKKKSIAELPAYIPSPVDLSMTSPFAVEDQLRTGWLETEIIPHAVAVSNITVTGKVLEVKKRSERMLELTLYVSLESLDEGDTMTIVCWNDFSQAYADLIHCDDYLFVCGVLRLAPVHESTNDKYYSTPVIHVASPTGVIAKIE